jgi:hypothetical protein
LGSKPSLQVFFGLKNEASGIFLLKTVASGIYLGLKTETSGISWTQN